MATRKVFIVNVELSEETYDEVRTTIAALKADLECLEILHGGLVERAVHFLDMFVN